MADYDRFWDLHISAQSGWYDFATLIETQGVQQWVAHREQLPDALNLITPRFAMGPTFIYPVPLGSTPLPHTGWVASMVRIDQILNRQRDKDFQALVAWVDSPVHVGKLRVNVHGNLDGTFTMGDRRHVYGDQLIDWLAANQLKEVQWTSSGKKRSSGLVTLALFACYSARYGAESVAGGANGTSGSLVPGSAMARVVSGLRRHKLHGIEVTGSNEAQVAGGHFWVQGARSRVVGPPPLSTDGSWTRGFDGRSVQVGRGWTVSPSPSGYGGTVTIPARYTVHPGPTNPHRKPPQGWLLVPTARGSAQMPIRDEDARSAWAVQIHEEWTVDEHARSITPPLGWRLRSNGADGGGTLEHTTGGLDRTVERLAHSPYKVRFVS